MQNWQIYLAPTRKSQSLQLPNIPQCITLNFNFKFKSQDFLYKRSIPLILIRSNCSLQSGKGDNKI